MIASLHGRLEAIGGDCAIIDVNGIGFQVFMPTSTLSSLGTTGKQIHLFTHFHLREDSATLYGFASADELELFQALISVSGIGPKLALAVLSAITVEQASMAIATGSVDLLTTIPGIGQKTANRLILELKDKIGARLMAAPAGQFTQDNADVLGALISLGYSVAEASRAVASLPRDKNLGLEERIKLALQYSGGK
jgi:Holliday junction DNA helicase RuvA